MTGRPTDAPGGGARQPGPARADAWFAGADGCRAGWFAVLARYSGDELQEARFRLCRDFARLLELPERPLLLALDMPIGLPERAEPGGRACDRAARSLLGPRRASVFPPPARPALRAASYPAAVAANGAGISLPAWNILPRVREVDDRMSAALQARVVECHPELAFLSLAGHPMRHRKKLGAGREERMRLLEPHFGRRLAGLEALRVRFGRSALAADDILDACALALAARRIHLGRGRRLPEAEPPLDATGLRMEIWY